MPASIRIVLDQPADFQAVSQSLRDQRTVHEDLRNRYYDTESLLRPHNSKRERIALGPSRLRRGGESTADELGDSVAELLFVAVN